MNNCARSIDMLNAAVLIDPDNTKMIKKITELRDKFVIDLVTRLELDIENDFPDKYIEIEKLITANELKKAEKLIDEFQSDEAKAEKALYIKGLLLYRNGNLRESVNCFDGALSLESINEKASFMKSRAQTLLNYVDKAAKEMSKSKYQEAVKTLTSALAVDKDNRILNQASYFQRALANFNAGYVESAFDDYKKFDLLNKLIGNTFNGIGLGAALTKAQTPEEQSKPTSDITEKKKKRVRENKKSSKVTPVVVKQTGENCAQNDLEPESTKQIELKDVKQNSNQQAAIAEITMMSSQFNVNPIAVDEETCSQDVKTEKIEESISIEAEHISDDAESLKS